MKLFCLFAARLLSLLLMVCGLPLSAQAAETELAVMDAQHSRLLASVHPLALVAASVLPIEQIDTLLPANVSPHDFSLKPSHLRLLQQADIILWSGAESEPYLAPFVNRWPQKYWLDISALLPDEHSHESAEEHDDHGHGAHQSSHGWLSPTLMMTVQAELAAQLGINDAGFSQQVKAQLLRDQQRLAAVKETGFFVFHRAYDFWIEQQGLNQLGAFSLTPQQKPGLRKLRQMRQQLQQGEAVCVFSEPQYSPALIRSLTSGLAIGYGELDPLGRHIAVSKQGYVAFLDDLSQRVVSCLQRGDR